MLSVLIALPFLMFGLMKVIGVEEMLNNMSSIHYSHSITRIIGLVEIILITGIFFSKFRFWSLLALLITLAGAVGSHIGAGQESQSIVIPCVLSIVVLIAIFIEAKEKRILMAK